MTWCPLLLLFPPFFPPFPKWKICTTATNTGHGGLWRSLGRQHPGLSERAGGTFRAADPSPRGGASQRHPAARACQPASQPYYQPTAGMAAGGDAGKWCQHAGQSPLVIFFNCQPDLPCVCHPASLSDVTLASLASSFHLSKPIPSSCLLTVIAFHCWWNSIISPFNFSVIRNTCSHCLNLLPWILCNNLLCGDSSLKGSWWDSTSHSVFPHLPPSSPLLAIQSHLLSPTGLWYCLVVPLIGCGLSPSTGQCLGNIRVLAKAPVNAGWLCRSRKCKM